MDDEEATTKAMEELMTKENITEDDVISMNFMVGWEQVYIVVFYRKDEKEPSI